LFVPDARVLEKAFAFWANHTVVVLLLDGSGSSFLETTSVDVATKIVNPKQREVIIETLSLPFFCGI
jgi:hypothetical protein